MSERKVVLVTGVSSGIGQSIARLLAERGFVVFGTSRNIADMAKITGVEGLPLDVRREESVADCLDTVLKQKGQLDVLINNAGYALRGAIEEASLEEVQAQFDTNFYGVLRLVKAGLPIMRRQGSGQIINISSLIGAMAVPFAGFYAASKFALEGYTEALRHEVKPFNIRVSLVEPYAVKTNFRRNSQLPADRIRDYAPWFERVARINQRQYDKAIDPSAVAQCVLRIVDSKEPRLRYQPDRSAASLIRLRRFLPESLFERMIRRRFGLDAQDRGSAQVVKGEGRSAG